MIVTLTRFAYTPYGAFGVMKAGTWSGYTVERPWHGNQRGLSCIPIGEYPLKRTMHYGGDGVGGAPDYECFEIAEVPDRSLIHIHIANTMDDLKGCVGPGEALGWIKGKWAVTSSRVAFHAFMEVMEGLDEARIVIENLEAGAL